jgi:protein-S-isoprenylcysteine O-methyltransferase Ste14
MGRKLFAIVGSAVFLAVAPGVVAGAVPWWISRWRMRPPFFGLSFFRFAGIVLLTLGVTGILDSFVRFATEGIGTPAPVFPTRRLVVSGLYRYVRNPMYVAVVATIVGQAFIFGDVRLLIYGALIWVLFHTFVLVYEEPTLQATFGSDYRDFCHHVPRWLPGFRRRT